MLSRLADRIEKRLLVDKVGMRCIQPAFQPIVDLRSLKISSFEVLARWEDKELGSIPPTTFIPLVEQFGMMTPMTEHLIRSACRSAATWPGNFRLTFNVSPTQFKNPALASIVALSAEKSGFAPRRLQIEITENAIIDDSAEIKETVARLKELGMRIILDDFGTGFSSLTRLQSVPFDKIKIDASFVKTMTQARDSRKIVSSVIGLGHSLGMSVVAEGVETAHQLALLRQLGCDYGQGYLFGRPSPAAAIPAMLDSLGQQPREASPLNLSCSQRLAELDCLYNNAPIALCFIDREARLLSANKRYGELLGLDPAASVGLPLFRHLPEEASIIRDDVKALLAGRIVQPRVITLRRGEKTGLATVAAVRDEDGEIVGVSFAVIEINTLADRAASAVARAPRQLRNFAHPLPALHQPFAHPG